MRIAIRGAIAAGVAQGLGASRLWAADSRSPNPLRLALSTPLRIQIDRREFLVSTSPSRRCRRGDSETLYLNADGASLIAPPPCAFITRNVGKITDTIWPQEPSVRCRAGVGAEYSALASGRIACLLRRRKRRAPRGYLPVRRRTYMLITVTRRILRQVFTSRSTRTPRPKRHATSRPPL